MLYLQYIFISQRPFIFTFDLCYLLLIKKIGTNTNLLWLIYQTHPLNPGRYFATSQYINIIIDFLLDPGPPQLLGGGHAYESAQVDIGRGKSERI